MSAAVQQVADHLRAHQASGDIVTFDTQVPTAAAAAEVLGCEVGAIANSLIFDAGGEAVLIVASGAHRVDTQQVAAMFALPPLRRASPEFVLAATGQPVGGVAPVGHPRRLRTVVDRHLESFPTVWAGAGTKEAMFPTTFAELVRMTGGTPAAVAKQAP